MKCWTVMDGQSSVVIPIYCYVDAVELLLSRVDKLVVMFFYFQRYYHQSNVATNNKKYLRYYLLKLELPIHLIDFGLVLVLLH